MSSDNEPEEYPHDNAWHTSMGFDPIEVPHEFMSVYGDPIETEVRVNLPCTSKVKKLKRKTSPINATSTTENPPTPDTLIHAKNPTNPVSVYIEKHTKTDQRTLTQMN